MAGDRATRDLAEIAARRLLAQGLVGTPFASASEVVRGLGAVQAQDYPAAKWALGLRTDGATDAGIDRLFDEGGILRTHVLRPTWHFVLPEDAGWMLELTGPRVRAGLRGRHRQLELDDDVAGRAHHAFRVALAGGRTLTRAELGAVAGAAGVTFDAARLSHLILLAELDRLIISGPRRGRQFTWALMADRVPHATEMDRAEAVGTLARRYFIGHGPAQLQDFVWWSGLTMADARAGVAMARESLGCHVVDGAEYWFDAGSEPPPVATSAAHLLPNFDEYTVAYRDRRAVVDPARPFDPAFLTMGSVLSNVVTVAGRVCGRWRRSTVGGGVRIDVDLVAPPRRTEARAIMAAAARMERFVERPVEVVLTH